MKKQMMKIGITLTLALVTSISLTGCNGSADANASENDEKVSKKGAWTDDEKQRALDELNTKRTEMEAMIGAEYTEKMYDCTMEKIQSQYNNFAEADSDHAGMRKIGSDCMTELIQTSNSTVGNWNEMDITRAKYQLGQEREQLDVLIGAEKTDLFIDCAIEKIQNKYNNFQEADRDLPGMEQIGADCMTDLLQQ